MRRKLIFVFVIIMMFSGCGIKTAATVTPVQSAVNTTATVTANQSASVSVPSLQLSVKGTKDGVDSFLSLYHYKSAYDGDECFNITPEAVKQAGYSVFKYNMSCASFLLYGGEAYPLCKLPGGFGVVSMAVYDLDKDGNPEFYFTFSWGSGLHRSQAGYFYPSTKQVTVLDFSCFDKDMLITGDASGLKLYRTDFDASSGFTDYSVQTVNYIADIIYDNNKVKLVPADGSPVSTQQASVQPSESQSPVSETKLYKYAGGKLIKESVITDEKGNEIVKNAVFNYLIKDSAYPALDIGKLKDYIEIHYQLGDDMEGLPSIYYAFEKDGKYCMQSDERYSYINDDLYKLLYDLASGYNK